MKIEQKEALEEFLHSEGYPALMEYMEYVVGENFENRLLNQSINPENERNFILEKARAEGARQYMLALSRNLAALKSKGREAPKSSHAVTRGKQK